MLLRIPWKRSLSSKSRRCSRPDKHKRKCEGNSATSIDVKHQANKERIYEESARIKHECEVNVQRKA